MACCDVVTDRDGNPAFRCRFPGCEKTYASRDAVRKHGRINHLQWLRSCGFEDCVQKVDEEAVSS